MILQAAGCANDNVATSLQGLGLAADVHAANAGRDAPAGRAVEPFEFTLHLKREFACGGNDQR